MQNLFNFVSKKKPLQERKEEYKTICIRNLEQYKFYIICPLSDIDEYRQIIHNDFLQLFDLLEEEFNCSLLIREFQKQYNKTINALTARLNTLREIAEEQPVTSEAALDAYKKTLNEGLDAIKKEGDEFFQQADKNITQLFTIFTTVLFERSDPFFDVTHQIRKAITKDFLNIQGETPVLSTYLTETLTTLSASAALPQTIKDQLAGILEKLTPLKSAQFVVFSLNEAFKSIPKELTEIARGHQSVADRLHSLQKFVEEKKVAKPLDYYLTTFQDYFSVSIKLAVDNKAIENDIKKQLGRFETQYDKCKQVKVLAAEYREKLSVIITFFDNEIIIDDYRVGHYSQLNKELIELKNELQEGSLFKKVKEKKLAELAMLKDRIESILNEDGDTIQKISGILNNSSVEINYLIKEHKKKRLEIEAFLEDYINACEQLKNLSDIENFIDVSKICKDFYDPLKIEIDEYHLAAGVLYSNFKVISEFRLNQISDPIECMTRVKNISDKVFHLLGHLTSRQLGRHLENLVYLVEASPQQVPGDNLSLLKNEFRAFVIEEKYLERFIAQQTEKICECLDQVLRAKGECYARLNGYLNNVDVRQLQALCERRKDLRRTVERIMSTKRLLELQNERREGSFWETCVLFYEFNMGKQPLPLFTTPQNKEWFDAVKTLIDELMQQLKKVDKKKSNYMATFFLCRDAKAKKQQALDMLKEYLEALPNLSFQQVLNEKLQNWETEFGAVIDKPRYRFYLIIFMTIYNIFKYYISGQTVETESRHCVEILKESLYKASAAMQANFKQETATNPLVMQMK